MPEMNENEEVLHMSVPVPRAGRPTPKELSDSLLRAMEGFTKALREKGFAGEGDHQLLTYAMYQLNKQSEKERHL